MKFSIIYEETKTGKNTHMQHIEDAVIDEGYAGAEKAIKFFTDLANTLSGQHNEKLGITTKLDGAPAIFIGKDPDDGEFFIAKKGLFNKTPKLYKSFADIENDTDGDLQDKLKKAFKYLKNSTIPDNTVYQGDLLFVEDSKDIEEADGEKYVTFQPNTINYAIPVNTTLGKKIINAKLGVGWHTTYTGDSISSMTASFGKGIANELQLDDNVWSVDAIYKDETGNATFTKSEAVEVKKQIKQAKTQLSNIDRNKIDELANNADIKAVSNIYANAMVRDGKTISNPAEYVSGLLNFVRKRYQAEIDKVSTEKSKIIKTQKMNSILEILDDDETIKIYSLIKTLSDLKKTIITKLNMASNLKTFLRTKDGLKVTSHEGFVAIDHLSNNAVKLVDRLEFSRANFSPEIIKGWNK